MGVAYKDENTNLRRAIALELLLAGLMGVEYRISKELDIFRTG
jgi:hypothetical protein